MRNLLLAISILTCAMAYAAKPVLPTDPGATKETVNLYQNMMKLQGKGLMFGHQDAAIYGNGWMCEDGRSDVKDVCGDYPAVYGWELGNIELGNAYNLDSVLFSKIQEGIKTTYKRGGINTISWHMHNPLTGGLSRDVSSKRAVASILPGGEKHQMFLGYLDKVADFLLSLKDENGIFIPVIFRPFHDSNANSFWWGKNYATVEEYKSLWRFTALYLRENKNVHHLLYAYSPDRFKTADEFLERNPGDDIVDIFGVDIYDRGGEYPAALKNCISILSKLAADSEKIVAVCETGGPIARNVEWWTRVLLESLRPYSLAYVMVWRNPKNKPLEAFAPYKGHASSNDFVKFYNDPKTLFQKDIASRSIYKQ